MCLAIHILKFILSVETIIAIYTAYSMTHYFVKVFILENKLGQTLDTQYKVSK